jgi:hypothetical protein
MTFVLLGDVFWSNAEREEPRTAQYETRWFAASRRSRPNVVIAAEPRERGITS